MTTAVLGSISGARLRVTALAALWLATFDMYPLESISMPSITPESVAGAPELALGSTSPWPFWGATVEQAREGKRAYYAAITFADAQVGRLLDALDRLALADRTIVVFWSDHGYFLGEKGLWAKMRLYDHDADPDETRNLAAEPAHAATVKQLHALVQRNWAAN